MRDCKKTKVFLQPLLKLGEIIADGVLTGGKPSFFEIAKLFVGLFSEKTK